VRNFEELLSNVFTPRFEVAIDFRCLLFTGVDNADDESKPEEQGFTKTLRRLINGPPTSTRRMLTTFSTCMLTLPRSTSYAVDVASVQLFWDGTLEKPTLLQTNMDLL
jgi:hypothetical protein